MKQDQVFNKTNKTKYKTIDNKDTSVAVGDRPLTKSSLPYPAGLTRDRPSYCCAGLVGRPGERLAKFDGPLAWPADGAPPRVMYGPGTRGGCGGGGDADCPECCGGIPQLSLTGEVSPSSPRGRDGLCHLWRRPGLAAKRSIFSMSRKLVGRLVVRNFAGFPRLAYYPSFPRHSLHRTLRLPCLAEFNLAY